MNTYHKINLVYINRFTFNTQFSINVKSSSFGGDARQKYVFSTRVFLAPDGDGGDGDDDDDDDDDIDGDDKDCF